LLVDHNITGILKDESQGYDLSTKFKSLVDFNYKTFALTGSCLDVCQIL